MVPYHTACLITLFTLSISFTASAEQRLVDVLFAWDVVNREAVGVFEPGAHCDKEAGSSTVPVIDSETERKVIFFNRIKSSAAGNSRHTWYQGDTQVGEVDLRIGVSPGWRTWSSKRIVSKAHAGNWKVVVSTVDEASEVICVAHFVVR
jgi:hypothetical protein